MMAADGKSWKNNGRVATIFVARVAILASLLTVGKIAFAALPNVEVVTLLIIVYGATLGLPYALTAALIFCTVEMALYSPHTWILMYYIYWPLLAVLSSLLLRRRNVFKTTVVAVVLAVIYAEFLGVLSSSVETLVLGTMSSEALGKYWLGYYLKGVYFDVVHMISNAIIVGVLFAPLVLLVRKLAPDACVLANGKMKKLYRLCGTYERETEEDGESDDFEEPYVVAVDAENERSA
ncbi:MAG: hypothetical protein IK048_01070 [Clostridia bacterium]|nr:hypothetical protein [Clostridia bacterium]